MIPEFVAKWEANKAAIRAEFEADHPNDYKTVVANVIKHVTSDDWCGPDPERIHVIDDGDYQGTLVFVIAEKGYQPNYWFVTVGYGSCSSCDTLQSIADGSCETPTPEQVDQYMTLALHIVQRLKKMGDE